MATDLTVRARNKLARAAKRQQRFDNGIRVLEAAADAAHKNPALVVLGTFGIVKSAEKAGILDPLEASTVSTLAFMATLGPLGPLGMGAAVVLGMLPGIGKIPSASDIAEKLPRSTEGPSGSLIPGPIDVLLDIFK